jgi:hypothetical protein
MLPELAAQPAVNLEHYHFWYKDETLGVPVVKFTSRKGWHASARYNYDAPETFSFSAGKEFSFGNRLTGSFIPATGFSAGGYKSVFFSIQQDYAWRSFTLSSESQYSISTESVPNSFFNWSEFLYEPEFPLFGGLALLATREGGMTEIEGGVVAGFTVFDISFPFYIFSPFSSGSYLAAGVNYEFTFSKRKTIQSKPIP